MKRRPYVIRVGDQHSSSRFCEIRQCVLRVRTRTLNAGVKELSFVGSDGLATVISHLVLRSSRCSVQRVHGARIGATRCQSTCVDSVETDVRTVGHADNALEWLFHSLGYYETTLSKIEYGFPSRQAVLLLHGVEQGVYVHPAGFFQPPALLTLKHLQNHLSHGYVGHLRGVRRSSLRLRGNGGILVVDLPLDGLRSVCVRTDHLLQLFLNHCSVRGEIGILTSSGAVYSFTQ